MVVGRDTSSRMRYMSWAEKSRDLASTTVVQIDFVLSLCQTSKEDDHDAHEINIVLSYLKPQHLMLWYEESLMYISVSSFRAY